MLDQQLRSSGARVCLERGLCAFLAWNQAVLLAVQLQ